MLSLLPFVAYNYLFTFLFRFGTRLGVPVGVAYVTTVEGLWGSQEEAVQLYEKLRLKQTEAGLDIPPVYEDKVSAAVEKVDF